MYGLDLSAVLTAIVFNVALSGCGLLVVVQAGRQQMNEIGSGVSAMLKRK